MAFAFAHLSVISTNAQHPAAQGEVLSRQIDRNFAHPARKS